MSHVEQPELEIHADIPGHVDIGPLLDENGDVLEPQAAPQFTLYFLDGTVVEKVAAAPAFSFPVTMEALGTPGMWRASHTTLQIRVGQRLRGIASFTDPAGNPCTPNYPAVVVPAVG